MRRYGLLGSPVISLLVFLATVLVFFVIPTHRISEPVAGLLKTLLVISFVHLVDTLILRGAMLEYIQNVLKLQSDEYTRLSQENLRSNFALLGNADRVGLVAVYPDRKAAVNDVYAALAKAERRVWILGIALTLAFKLDTDILKDLCDKSRKKDFELRILLLDALRSPAVWRTFLESEGEDVKAMLETDPEDKYKEHPYFNQKLYTDFGTTFATFNANTYKALRKCVRYYAHSPSFWMVILDDEIFFEPYTFGKPPDSKEARIGGGLPVFRFRNLPGRGTYETLCDHYRKMWLTSDIDLFEVEARRRNRGAILKRILDRGRNWMKNAYEVLSGTDEWKKAGEDRREYPRFVFDPDVKVFISWAGSGPVEAWALDIAREGLRIQVAGGVGPPEMSEVELVRISGGGPEEDYMINQLLNGSAARKLVVMKVRGDTVILRAQGSKSDRPPA